MKLAQIEDGIVANVIEVDPAHIPDWAAGWPDAQDAGPGWTWDGEGYAPPAEPAPETKPVPPAISRFQARAALLQVGLLSAVEQAVSQADPLVRLAWAEAIEWRRDSAALNSIAAAIGLTEAEMDDLFRAAAAIAI